MNILVLGSGGREHAIARKLAQSKDCNQVFVAPGNAGTQREFCNLPIKANAFEQLAEAVREHAIELVVVGPEEPLVNGIREFLALHCPNVAVIGPGKAGARLEGSKQFAKEFMLEFGIPTAAYFRAHADNWEEATSFLRRQQPPYVLKADGLAAGKGVVICDALAEAESVLKDMLSGSLVGHAGHEVVIESFLKGIEVSVFFLTDGEGYAILPEAKDYKRIGENDDGPNTGGMGAVSPVPFMTPELWQKIEKRIIQPTIHGLKTRNIDYRGFVFLGLMLCDGDPFVIEYNCRMGDPETEVVMPRIQDDLLPLLLDVHHRRLTTRRIATIPETVVGTVLVSGGYPGAYQSGQTLRVTGDEKDLIHAGTVSSADGSILTAGGRVMIALGYGRELREAAITSRSLADHVHFEGKYFRRDIGNDLLPYSDNLL